MKCNEIEEMLAARLAGELAEADQRKLSQHLQSCVACSEIQEQVAQAAEALDSWEVEPANPDLAQRTIDSLQAERARSLSLWENVRLFFDKLQNLDVTPARAALAAACGLVLYMGLMNVEHRAVVAATSADTCRGNVNSLGKAIDKYRFDHDGQTPEELGQLIPDYMMRIPNCPSAGFDTYSQGYEIDGKVYHVHCHGHHHKDENFEENSPRLKGGGD